MKNYDSRMKDASRIAFETSDRIKRLTEASYKQLKLGGACESISKQAQGVLTAVEPMGGYMQQLTSSIEPIIEMERNMRRMLSQSLGQAYERIQSLPENLRKGMLALAEEGWFFDLEMTTSTLNELQEALDSGKINEVEDFLIGHFRNNLSDIQERVYSEFPHRSHITKKAFYAHIRGDYELSIPVIMTQIDGACYDKTKQSYFMRTKGKPNTAKYVDSLTDEVLKTSLFSLLTESLPVHASKWERERNKGFNNINRHLVMHGESLDYGTELNSLKVISMMNYLTQVLPNLDI